MKEVYSYQEVKGSMQDGQAVTFTRPVTVKVTAAQKPMSQTMQVTFELLCGQDSIGDFITEIEDMKTLLAAFGVADHDEILDLLEFLSDE